MKENWPRKMIGLFGKGYVGKTSLVYKLLSRELNRRWEPIIEDVFHGDIDIRDQGKRTFDLLVTGEEDQPIFVNVWLKNVDGFLLVFSIDNKESFEFMKHRYKQIKDFKKEKNPINCGE